MADIIVPSLKEFLKITELTKYDSKLKKAKCIEIEDLRRVPQVGMLAVEEKRMLRYLEYFQDGTQHEFTQKPQPVTIENCLTLAQLNHQAKNLKKFGVVEFDDLDNIPWPDLASLLPLRAESHRFQRYVQRCKNDPELVKKDLGPASKLVSLESFYSNAGIQKQKSVFKKFGVAEMEDLWSIERSDMVKAKFNTVELERFERHRKNLVPVPPEIERRPSMPQAGQPMPPPQQTNIHMNVSIQQPPPGQVPHPGMHGPPPPHAGMRGPPLQHPQGYPQPQMGYPPQMTPQGMRPTGPPPRAGPPHPQMGYPAPSGAYAPQGHYQPQPQMSMQQSQQMTQQMAGMHIQQQQSMGGQPPQPVPRPRPQPQMSQEGYPQTPYPPQGYPSGSMTMPASPTDAYPSAPAEYGFQPPYAPQ